MKIRIKDLRLHYEAYLKERKKHSQTKCLNPEELIHLVREELSHKKKMRCVEHLADCKHCTQKYQQINQVLKQEKRLLNEIAESFERKSSDKILKKKYHKLIPSFFPMRFAWIFGGLILIVVLSFFVNKIILKKQHYRGSPSKSVQLIKPVGRINLQKSLVFKWVGPKDSKYYTLELFDKSLAPLWISNKIFKSEFGLPQEVIRKLIPEKTYFWMVTAHFDSYNKITSPIGNFFFR